MTSGSKVFVAQKSTMGLGTGVGAQTGSSKHSASNARATDVVSAPPASVAATKRETMSRSKSLVLARSRNLEFRDDFEFLGRSPASEGTRLSGIRPVPGKHFTVCAPEAALLFADPSP